jgi:hypothetical protein
LKIKPCEKIKTKNAIKFKRLVGISQNNFCDVVERIKSHYAKRNWLQKRGINKSKMSMEDRISHIERGRMLIFAI